MIIYTRNLDHDLFHRNKLDFTMKQVKEKQKQI